MEIRGRMGPCPEQGIWRGMSGNQIKPRLREIGVQRLEDHLFVGDFLPSHGVSDGDEPHGKDCPENPGDSPEQACRNDAPVHTDLPVGGWEGGWVVSFSLP
jgi:hypothetical protein